MDGNCLCPTQGIDMSFGAVQLSNFQLQAEYGVERHVGSRGEMSLGAAEHYNLQTWCSG